MKRVKKALIIVDVQNDFCPGGALAVTNGDEVVQEINQLQKQSFDLIVATQDFHPKNHKSFASNNPGKNPYDMSELHGSPQVMWPDHCVQGSKGADFHKDLNLKNVSKVFQKGTNPEVDSYSGFFDNDKKSSTGLSGYLKSHGISSVTVVGLALDYCVKATALDAVAAGFETEVVLEATRAVNLSPTDGGKAAIELSLAGVKVSQRA